MINPFDKLIVGTEWFRRVYKVYKSICCNIFEKHCYVEKDSYLIENLEPVTHICKWCFKEILILPEHPNCRCMISPESKEIINKINKWKPGITKYDESN